MKLTNNKNLPSSFVKALSRDFHKSADYSASQLTKSPRMVHLENRHKDKVVEDVTDKIWALFGSAVHAVLENGETENQLVEEYFCEEIEGVKLSGMCDLYENSIVFDYKVSSVWTYIYLADKIADFESQLNTYAWFFRKKGFKVDGLKIVLILRDWQSSKAKFDPKYPDCQVQVIDINLWSNEKIEDYLEERIRIYEYTKQFEDKELPECSEKERWAKPGTWAVMKKGRKSALRVLATQDLAMQWMDNNGKGDAVEERKGEMWKRCDYCSVSAFCNQYNERDK